MRLSRAADTLTIHPSSSRSRDFVHTISQNFAIESQPFFFAGTNAYWS